MSIEKEKMLKGQFYNTRDPELLKAYHHARDLLKKFNQAESSDTDLKFSLIKELLGHVGEGVWIESPFSCDYGEHISIGRNTFINFNCVLLDDNKIEIGEHCLLGPGVQIYTAGHPLEVKERLAKNQVNHAPFKTFSKPVRIGNNVWIGGNSVILPGIEIGEGTTIGAGSVVTKNIPSGVLAYGNPCRVIREIK